LNGPGHRHIYSLTAKQEKTGCAVKSQSKFDLIIVCKSQQYALGPLNP